MVLLFVGGVMNLLWVAAIVAFVLVEKLFPAGEITASFSKGWSEEVATVGPKARYVAGMRLCLRQYETLLLK